MKKSIFLIALAVATVLSIDSCKSDAQSVSKSDLEQIIKEQNKLTPINVTPGIVLNMIELIDDYVTYVYTVDESEDYYGESFIDNLKMNMNSAKDNMKAIIRGAKDDDTKKLLETCINLNVGIAYKYVGSITDKSLTIKVDPEELKELK